MICIWVSLPSEGFHLNTIEKLLDACTQIEPGFTATDLLLLTNTMTSRLCVLSGVSLKAGED